jgi:hypothetical protein
MGRPSRYSPEVRERAVRMVFEIAEDYDSQWAGNVNLIWPHCDGLIWPHLCC